MAQDAAVPAGPAEAATVPADAVPATADAPAGATSSTEPAAGTSSNSGLQDIIVTAQRRSENLQRAALAISAVPADTLARAGVTDTTQLTRVAPAIQIGNIGGTSTAFYLRGVGNFTANSLSDAAVSVNLDGVPIVRSNAIQGLFYDLERVEVLKGPQGTLYGRNATGGAINLLTAKPIAGELSGYLNGEYGNYDAIKVQGAVNIPAGENGAFRVSGMFSDRDGFYSDGTGDEKMRAIRVQGAAKLTDTFRITAGGDFAFVGGVGSGATVASLDKDDLIGLGDARAGAVYASSYAPRAGAFLQALTPNDQFQSNRYWGMYAQAELDTGIGTITLLPSHRESDIRLRNFGSGFATTDRLQGDQTTVEARLTSDSTNRLSYIIGGFFLDENYAQRANYAQGFQNFANVFSGSTKSYAGFGRLTFKVTDRFRVTGGARYTIDKKKVEIDSLNSIVVCPAAQAGGNCLGTPTLPDPGAGYVLPTLFADANRNPTQGPGGSPIPYGNGAILINLRQQLDPSRTFKKLTYRAGVEFDLAPQSLLYASYETGFKSGGFFASIVDPVYQPETINAITLGSKNRFLDNKLQLNIEAFWWDYKDQQVSQFKATPVPGQPGNTILEFATVNVGKTRVRGVEIEGVARVAENTTLNATVQYLDAKYRDFAFDTPFAAGPPVTGCPVQVGASGYTVNCTGRRAINAPEWTINAGIEQAFDIAGGRLVFNLDGRYESSSYKGFEQLPGMKQDGYFLGNAQVQYAFAGSRLTIGAFVNNITNEKVINFATPHVVAPSLIINSLRPPRFYGVRAGVKF
ncbi:iron complex outermembrane receptor protein [Novosphingobium chloroacetimidivorans]|uniref:Iron complex outermembrane receptor protein n=2 Tax=Novosphingobium chloroacetimidivorans TaxID=1428314 RepID=A0A7W7K9E6_9SPHN|nr:iron complex outermembrane receptor protein [Novosphingobium chloroacetimidivorans]